MLTDLYVLAPERSAALIGRFLDHFLPAREPAAREYEAPQYAEQPDVVFADALGLIRFCENHPDVRHAIYWNNVDRGGEPRSAHVFFLPDGGLVLGLSTANRSLPEQDRLFAELKRFTGSVLGYLTVETPPATDTAEFTRLAKNPEEVR